jgi:WD40 repeat protein
MLPRIASVTALLLLAVAAPAAADITFAGCFRPGAPGAGCAGMAGPDRGGLNTVTTADGRWIVSAQGGIRVFERTPGGVVFRRCYGQPDGGCEPLDLSGVRAVALSPDGRWLVGTSDVGDLLVWYRFDAGAGTLTQAGCLAAGSSGTGCPAQPELDGAANPVFSPDGRHLYVGVGEDPRTAILTFAFDAATGAPRYANCVAGRSSPVTCAERAAGLRTATAYGITPDGRAVYASGHGIAMLARDASTGQLRGVGCIDEDDEFGACPMHAPIVNGTRPAISPDGSFVYFDVGATIRGWRRDARTQQLTPGPCITQSADSTVCRTESQLVSQSELVMAPDGRNLYTLGISFARTANDAAGEWGISEIARDPATGALGLGGACAHQRGGTVLTWCTVEADGFLEPLSLDISADGTQLFAMNSGLFQGSANAAMAVFARTPRPLPTPPAAARKAPPLVLADSGTGSRRRAHVPVGCGEGSRCSGTVTLSVGTRPIGRRSFSIPAGEIAEVKVPLDARTRRRLAKLGFDETLEARARIVRTRGAGAKRETLPVALDRR